MAFEAQLKQLQAARGFSDFLRTVHEEGTRVVVTIIPARPRAHAEELDGAASLDAGFDAGLDAGLEVGGGFDRGTKKKTTTTTKPPTQTEATPVDETLAQDLKKALFIPRR